MLEPELLADSEIETALGVQFSHAIGEREILNWDGAAASFHLASLRPGASNIFGVIGKILMGRPMYRYQLKDMRKGGLLTTPVISRLAARNSSPESLSESAKKLLKDLVSVARERKLEVIYGLPWVFSDEENAHLVRGDRSKFLNDVEKIMPVIYEEGLGVNTEKINFRDSPQHLSETGSKEKNRATRQNSSGKICGSLGTQYEIFNTVVRWLIIFTPSFIASYLLAKKKICLAKRAWFFGCMDSVVRVNLRSRLPWKGNFIMKDALWSF
jgi:hypothetical protein